ncbi:MAG: class I SAM-dependent methyltransferase [Leptospiraceae bacterium]|nr:class I SAM-dependent methyltransferase [Leptospiraceae bacterium]
MIEQIKRLGFEKNHETFIWTKETFQNFSYSDGDRTENYLLDSIRSCGDRSTASFEIRKFIKDWPSLYHLSRRRANILRPFVPILKGKTVLEIGCGCGALSRYLGEIGANLIAVEGSPRRALITRERCRELVNVEVVNATSEMVSGLIDFDIVILNGVLEYSPMFLGKNGPLDLLKNSFDQLNDQGALIVAIENQLGLKYFAGQPEDHANYPMYGINDSYRDGEFRTWGRKELEALIYSAGFHEIEQYIPLPDYKLPVSIVTPDGWRNFQSELNQLAVNSVNNDPQNTPHYVFSLERSYQSIWKNNLAADLANSFLMIAYKGIQKKIPHSNALAYHFVDDMKIGFNHGFEIFLEGSDIKVKVFPLDGDSTEKFDQGNLSAKKFLFEGNHWLGLLQILNRVGWTEKEVIEWARIWIFSIQEKAGLSGDACLDATVDGAFWDMIPQNAFRDKFGKFLFLGQEIQRKEKVTFGSVLFHGLMGSFQKVSSVGTFHKSAPVSLLNLTQAVFGEIFRFQIDDFFLSRFESEQAKIIAESFESINFDKSKNNKFLEQRNPISEYKVKIEALEKIITDIYGSTSWKITAPFRKIIAFFKKFK